MKILLVEETENRFSALSDMLKELGHEVFRAQTLKKVWALRDEENLRFLMLSEAFQERETLLQRLRAQPENVYILLLADCAKEDFLAETLYAGADDCLRADSVSLPELAARVALGERILRLEAQNAELQHQLEHLAMLDTLTGLMNRHAIYQLALAELERARRFAGSFSVVMVDLNHFSEINKEYGALAGDEALKEVARIIKERLRPYDTLGRWEGNTFLVVLPGVSAADAQRIAERIVEGIRSIGIAMPGGKWLTVQASAGVVTISKLSAAVAVLDDILQKAREALLRAREPQGEVVEVVWM